MPTTAITTTTNTTNTSSLFNSFVFRGIDIRETSMAACRIQRFLTYFFLEMSSCILCLLSIDRFFGIVLVLKAFRFNRASIAHKIVLILVCLIAAVNCHFLIFMGYYETRTVVTVAGGNQTLSRVVCRPDKSNYYYTRFWKAFFFLDTIIYTNIPFLVMVTCNVCIIAKIVKSRVRSKQVIIDRKKSLNNEKRIVKNTGSMLATEKRISIILVSISFSFLLFTLPVFIIEHLTHFSQDPSIYTNNPNWDIIVACAYMMMHFNHMINFFFYCFMGPKFRNEIKKLLLLFMPAKRSIRPTKLSKSHYNTTNPNTKSNSNQKFESAAQNSQNLELLMKNNDFLKKFYSNSKHIKQDSIKLYKLKRLSTTVI
jgi:hypothetical protein